jgi:hypothetical protein
MSKNYERIKSVAVHCGSRPHLIGAIAKQMPESRHPSRPFDIFNTPNCQKVGIFAILLP